MHRLNVDWSMKAPCNSELSLKKFECYLKERGYREATQAGYLGNVKRYLKFTEVDHPSHEDLEDFKAYLADEKLSRNTWNQYNYAIAAYHKMLGEEIHVQRLEPNNQIPHYFDKEDIIKIFGVINNLKHYAMLQTLFYCALRATELCNLDDRDIDLKSCTLWVREGKGGKDGLVPISNECVRTLKTYLQARPILTINGKQPLFYTDHSQRWERKSLYRMFEYYKNKARIEKIGGLHVFARHSPATILIANGCDIRIVQKILRHNDIRTTLRYAHVSDKTQREAYEKYLIL